MLTFEKIAPFVANSYAMGRDNTLIYVIAGIILLHFIVGIGYLLYKLTKKK
jgi:hypothetical protein|nr:hypothetical protein [Allomuricauda sp.]